MPPAAARTDPDALPWGRALAVWALIAAAETVHGVLRGLLLVPAVGQAAAARIGFGVGCVIVLGIAWATRRWLGARSAAAQWRIGLLWAALMLGFELAIGRAQGFGWARIAAEFDPTRGGPMAFGLLLVAAAPRLAARLPPRPRAAGGGPGPGPEPPGA
jgi:hypothetical protein